MCGKSECRLLSPGPKGPVLVNFQRRQRFLSASAPSPSFGSVCVVVMPVDADGGGRMKIKIHDKHTIFFGNEQIDLGCVEQLVDKSQTRAIGQALLLAMRVIREPEWRGRCLTDILAAIDGKIDGRVGGIAAAPFIVTAYGIADTRQPNGGHLVGHYCRDWMGSLSREGPQIWPAPACWK